MKIAAVIGHLESVAPPSLQENYDNAGLLTGSANWECTGILCALDSTEDVIDEAIQKKCNLVVAHHPIIFGGLKKINGKNYVERTVIKAIKNDIAIYAIHTNLDNVIAGVNGRMADKLGLINRTVLAPKAGILKKLITFVPLEFTEKLRQAIFNAGGGHIGNYSECSFGIEGIGTYKAGENTKPFAGEQNQLHHEPETRLEILFPAHLESTVVQAMKEAHPYEEVAYDIIPLSNEHPQVGSGLVGTMPQSVPEKEFLAVLKKQFGLEVVRHTTLSGQPIQKVALCGGAGSFLISKALAAGVDAFITADMKYHEFFDADGRLLICDIGHFESEQFTINLLTEILQQKFPTFAVLKSDTKTNPIYYYF